MLVRSRLSRIFYRRRFFDYPLKLNMATLGNLGAPYTAAIGASYLAARLNPRRPERTLEDFLINRFGDTLYRTFFKDYTEKVWGVPCSQISAEWGAQRIKGLSISKAIGHALSKPFRRAATPRRNPPRQASLNGSCIRSSGPDRCGSTSRRACSPPVARFTCAIPSSAWTARARRSSPRRCAMRNGRGAPRRL